MSGIRGGIVDAHHHIWRQADLPWLLGPMQPRIFGPHEALRRDCLIAEYPDDIEGLGVTKPVYVQANRAPDRAPDEAAWVQSVAGETGWPHAIVGFADFAAGDVRPALDRLARTPLMRGIRQQLHWHEDPLYRFAARPDLGSDPEVQRNVAHLAQYGWSFDLQLFAGQMAHGAALAEACPEVTFILQHAGMPEDLSEAGMAEWEAGMQRLAACANVVTKLSAFGTFIHRNDPALIADIVARTVTIFGPKRCLWGSNFPIERIWTDCAALPGAHLDACAGLSKPARQAIFHDSAARVCRL